MSFDGDRNLVASMPFNPAEDPAFVKELSDLFATRYYTNRGPVLQRFEAELLNYLSNIELNVVTTTNATLGLELTLKAMGLKGKVIVSPFTFVATVNAIVNAGLEPVFADIDPHTLCLAPASVEKKITPDVCAVMPVHVFGNPCDLDYFQSLRAKGMKVIYDSAHAFGVKRKGLPLAGHGDAEVFSFHSTKVMHSIEGGAVISKDAELISRIRLLTNFGIANEFEVKSVGTNAKMSELHALVGIYVLKSLKTLIEKRRAASDYYRGLLKGEKQVELLKVTAQIEGNGQYFPLLLPNDKVCEQVYSALRARGVYARRYFYPLVTQFEAYKKFSFQKTPIAAGISQRVLCLPLHTYLISAHQDFIFGIIHQALNVSSKRRTQ